MKPFCAIDFETFDQNRDSACAVGLARVEGARIVRRESALIRPPRSTPHPACLAVHGLRWADVSGAPRFADVWRSLAPILEGVTTLAAHNASFDRSVLLACCEAADLSLPECDWLCTLQLARARWPKPHSCALPAVCARLGIPFSEHHKAGADAEACAKVLLALEGRVPAAPAIEVATPEPDEAPFESAGLAGEILKEIPLSLRTSAVLRLMRDSQYLGPTAAEDLVRRVTEHARSRKVGWFVCPACAGPRSWLTSKCLACLGEASA